MSELLLLCGSSVRLHHHSIVSIYGRILCGCELVSVCEYAYIYCKRELIMLCLI